MQGFKNCPSVTEFAVGMRAHMESKGGKWFRVVFVDESGCALTRYEEEDISDCVSCPLHPKDIEYLTLDLASMWVGREYENAAGKTAKVLLSDEKYVAFSFNRTVLRRVWSRASFLSTWTPLPLTSPAEPQPVSLCDTCKSHPSTCTWRIVGSRVTTCGHYKEKGPAQPWTPKPGEPCLWGEEKNRQVEVLHAHGGYSFVLDPVLNMHYLVPVDDLHPIPPEPPVKVDDVVEVKSPSQTKPYYGRVSGVDPIQRTFSMEIGPERHTCYWDKVTVTKLVPEKP